MLTYHSRLDQECVLVNLSIYYQFGTNANNFYIYIGKKYGMMMMKVAIAHVIRKFKLTTPYKNVADIRLRQDTLIQPVEGYKLQLELRERI